MELLQSLGDLPLTMAVHTYIYRLSDKENATVSIHRENQRCSPARLLVLERSNALRDRKLLNHRISPASHNPLPSPPTTSSSISSPPREQHTQIPLISCLPNQFIHRRLHTQPFPQLLQHDGQRS